MTTLEAEYAALIDRLKVIHSTARLMRAQWPLWDDESFMLRLNTIESESDLTPREPAKGTLSAAMQEAIARLPQLPEVSE